MKVNVIYFSRLTAFFFFYEVTNIWIEVRFFVYVLKGVFEVVLVLTLVEISLTQYTYYLIIIFCSTEFRSRPCTFLGTAQTDDDEPKSKNNKKPFSMVHFFDVSKTSIRNSSALCPLSVVCRSCFTEILNMTDAPGVPMATELCALIKFWHLLSVYFMMGSSSSDPQKLWSVWEWNNWFTCRKWYFFCFHPGCFDRANETESVTRILQSIEMVQFNCSNECIKTGVSCVWIHVCCTQEQFGSKDSLGSRLWRSAEVEVI